MFDSIVAAVITVEPLLLFMPLFAARILLLLLFILRFCFHCWFEFEWKKNVNSCSCLFFFNRSFPILVYPYDLYKQQIELAIFFFSFFYLNGFTWILLLLFFSFHLSSITHSLSSLFTSALSLLLALKFFFYLSLSRSHCGQTSSPCVPCECCYYSFVLHKSTAYTYLELTKWVWHMHAHMKHKHTFTHKQASTSRQTSTANEIITSLSLPHHVP